MTRVFIWKNNSPQEWEEISFSAFSKARRNGCFTGRFFVETVKMFRDEDDRIIMECSRKDFEKYQQEDRHSRYLQEHEKSRSIFPASHVGDRDGTEEGYQDTDLFVDESVDTAEQAICNLLMADLHRALQQLSQKERSFIREHSLKGNGLLCSLRNTVVLLCPFHNSFNFSLLLPIQICRHFDVSCLRLLFEKQFVQPPFPVCTDASRRHNSCPSDKGEPWDERIWSE